MTQLKEETYQATGSPRRLVHANMYSGDFERSFDFYNQVLGIEETFRMAEDKVVFMSNGNTHHDLAFVQVADPGDADETDRVVPRKRPDKPELNHFAFEMYNEAELVAAFHRLDGAGIGPLGLEDRIVTRSVYFHDPEGQGIEFTVDMLRNWRDYRKPGVTVAHKPYVPEAEPPKTETFVNLNPEIRRVESAPLHAKRTAHATITAKDFPKLRQFYKEMIGLQELYFSPNGEWCVLQGKDYPGYSLVLTAASAHRRPGVHQVAFEVVSAKDLEGAGERLAAKGVEVEYKIEHPKKQAVCFRDPDGVLIQAYHEEPGFLEAIPEMDPDLALLLL
ncbi:VOC family protein [Dehalococcoidia bacterium]|nr:VOC family protein [Dehalococcoidia bacterium]